MSSAVEVTPKKLEDRVDPYGSKVKQLQEAVLFGPRTLNPTVRKAASLAAELPDALGPYVQKVAKHAYKVTDEEMTAASSVGLFRRSNLRGDGKRGPGRWPYAP